MKQLLLSYHTQSGNTGKLIAAVQLGAERCADEVRVQCKRAFDTTLDDLLRCDAMVFGTAEYNGYMSGALKDLFDRTYEPARGKVDRKPYAVVVSAGNDGTFAVQYIERIARGYGWKRVAEPVIVVGPVDSVAEARCVELGETLAAGLALGIY
jgi:multimeric flavodoxin WrbA